MTAKRLAVTPSVPVANRTDKLTLLEDEIVLETGKRKSPLSKTTGPAKSALPETPKRETPEISPEDRVSAVIPDTVVPFTVMPERAIVSVVCPNRKTPVGADKRLSVDRTIFISFKSFEATIFSVVPAKYRLSSVTLSAPTFTREKTEAPVPDTDQEGPDTVPVRFKTPETVGVASVVAVKV